MLELPSFWDGYAIPLTVCNTFVGCDVLFSSLCMEEMEDCSDRGGCGYIAADGGWSDDQRFGGV